MIFLGIAYPGNALPGVIGLDPGNGARP